MNKNWNLFGLFYFHNFFLHSKLPVLQTLDDSIPSNRKDSMKRDTIPIQLGFATSLFFFSFAISLLKKKKKIVWKEDRSGMENMPARAIGEADGTREVKSARHEECVDEASSRSEILRGKWVTVWRGTNKRQIALESWTADLKKAPVRSALDLELGFLFNRQLGLE